MPVHPLTVQRLRRQRTSLLRDIAAFRATLFAARELHAHVEALRAAPMAGADPIANRVRNSYLDDELARLARQIREFDLSVDEAGCELAAVGCEIAEAGR